MHSTTLRRRATSRVGALLAAALLTGGLVVGPALVPPTALAEDGGTPAATDAAAPVVSSTFEDGSTAPWVSRGGTTVAVSNTQSHGGTSSMLVSGRTAN